MVLTLVSAAGNVSILSKAEPTLDLEAAVTMDGSRVLGDRRYQPAVMRVRGVYVGTPQQVIAHLRDLWRAMRTAQRVAVMVENATYTRPLVPGGRLRLRRRLVPKAEFDVELVPGAPLWTGPGGAQVMLWW